MNDQHDFKKNLRKILFKNTFKNRTNDNPDVDEQNELRSEENLRKTFGKKN